MPWSVFIVRRAERDLERLDERTRELILRRIREAALDPGSADLAKLGGRVDEWRIRVGSWRVIVELNAQTGQMRVTRILNRRDAYR
jgi:mRNA interferase RelE/StbE